MKNRTLIAVRTIVGRTLAIAAVALVVGWYQSNTAKRANSTNQANAADWPSFTSTPRLIAQNSVPNAGNNDQPIVKVDAHFTTPAADGTAQLIVTAKIESTWHIYSVTQGTGGPVPSAVTVDKVDGVTIAGAFMPTVWPDRKKEASFDNLMTETHHDQVTWVAPVKIVGVDATNLNLVGRVHAQACNDKNCSPPQDYEFKASWAKDQAPLKAADPPAESFVPPSIQAPEQSPAQPPPNSAGLDDGPPQRIHHFVAKKESSQAKHSADEPLVTVEAGFTQPDSHGNAQLIVTATVVSGWHIYSTTQQGVGPIPSRINVTDTAGFRLKGAFQAKDEPHFNTKSAFKNVTTETYEGHVTWFAPVEVTATLPKELKIEGTFFAQACSGTTCVPPKDFAFTAGLSAGLKPITGVPFKAAPAQPHVAATSPAPPSKAGDSSASPAGKSLPWQKFTTVAALGNLLGHEVDLKAVGEHVRVQAAGAFSVYERNFFGFLGGLGLNVMPCVFPVIGLKLLSFVEQSGHNRAKAFLLNISYSLGLLSVFCLLATLAVFANLGWGQLFSNAWFSISLIALVFVMGLSFLGVWEVPIPGFASRSASSDVANQEGAVGAFVKGLLTTVIATPCSAPWLGTSLIWAAAQPPWLTYAVMVSAGLGMASPYLLIGAFPSLIAFMPKPGQWMETFKEVMGFVLLGTVVFFLKGQEPALVVPIVGFLFALWAACWWIGRISPLADWDTKTFAWGGACAFAAVVGLLMFPAIDDTLDSSLGFRSLATVMRGRAAQSGFVAPAQGMAAPGLVAMRPRAVMIDFTADWCINCKQFERSVLNDSTVVQAVREHNVLPLSADWTNGDKEVTSMLEVLNVGRAQIPTLAIFNPKAPNAPIVFWGPCSEHELLDAIARVAPLDGNAVADAN